MKRTLLSCAAALALTAAAALPASAQGHHRRGASRQEAEEARGRCGGATGVGEGAGADSGRLAGGPMMAPIQDKRS